MRITYDSESQVVHITVRPPSSDQEQTEEKGKVLLDIDNTKEVIQVEILEVTQEPKIILVDRSNELIDAKE